MTIAEPIYTWESVVAVVPVPTSQQAALYTIQTDPADLIESGTRIRSGKILTDLVRWAGQVAEFLPKATKEQKKMLLGFSGGFFSVLVYEGVKLRDMVGARGGNVDDRETKRAGLIAAAAQSFADGQDERERLANALAGLAHVDPTVKDRLDLAVGRAGDAEELSRSLHALVELARGLRADPTSLTAQQLDDGGVDDAELKAIEVLADEVKTSAAKADGARAQGVVTQADLDLQDGICLAHMEKLRRIFNGAHDRDPTVPHLVSIATRRIFAPVKKKKEEGPAGPATPAAGATAEKPAAKPAGGGGATGGSGTNKPN
jgi:hypothetical protein